MADMKYIGCFCDYQELCDLLAEYDRQVLFRTIRHPHVTFAYRPTAWPEELFGTPVTVRAVGYGCDGENEALQIEFAELPEALREWATAIAVPHITLSVAKTGRSVNSGSLDFTPIAPFEIKCVFGGMDEAGKLHL